MNWLKSLVFITHFPLLAANFFQNVNRFSLYTSVLLHSFFILYIKRGFSLV